MILLKKGKLTKILFSLFLALGAFWAFSAKADFVGQRVNFSIDPSYDNQGRSEAMAVMLALSNKAYFYIDEDWWNALDQSKQVEAKKSLEYLFITSSGVVIFPKDLDIFFLLMSKIIP